MTAPYVTNVVPGSGPQNGGMTATAPSSYTPRTGFHGLDQFRYTVKNDAGETSNEATMRIFVDAPPTCEDEAVELTVDQRLVLPDLLCDDADGNEFTIIVGDPMTDLDPSGVFGAIFQYPGASGEIRDFREAITRLHEAGALAVMAADPLALTLLVPPGQLGADSAVGSTQRFGVPIGYGGPHAAFMAVRAELHTGNCRSEELPGPCRPQVGES